MKFMNFLNINDNKSNFKTNNLYHIKINKYRSWTNRRFNFRFIIWFRYFIFFWSCIFNDGKYFIFLWYMGIGWFFRDVDVFRTTYQEHFGFNNRINFYYNKMEVCWNNYTIIWHFPICEKICLEFLVLFWMDSFYWTLDK